MKSTYLRIGNKLQKDNGEIYTVLRLDNTNDVLVEEQRGLLTLGYNLFGIPLTEEWLLKFGFKQLDKYTFCLKNLFIYKRKRGFVTGSKKREIKIDYVHKLQNWWFVNIEEELEYQKIQFNNL